jgi:hypothetical protein
VRRGAGGWRGGAAAAARGKSGGAPQVGRDGSRCTSVGAILVATLLELAAIASSVAGCSSATVTWHAPDGSAVESITARPGWLAAALPAPVGFASDVPVPGGVAVAWVPATGGAPPASYLVLATERGGRVAAATRVCGTCDVASLGGLHDGTGYEVSVVPVGAHGARGPTVEAGWVTPERPPPPPRRAEAEAGGSLAAIVRFVPGRRILGAGPVERYVVEAENVATGAYAGAVYACAACRSAVVGGLSAGQTYRFAVMAQDAGGDSLPAVTNPVRIRDPECRRGLVCVAVGPGTDGQALARADGFLMGLSAATPRARVEALAPRSWRVVYGPAERLAQGYGAKTTEMLSDAWYDATYSPTGRGALAPWADWTRYEQFVTSYVRRAVARGFAPAFWDVQNEPGPDYLEDGARGSPILWLETYRVASSIIEQEDPGAGVVGPSIGVFADAPGRGVPGAPDLATFVDFVARYHLPLSAVSFHEIGPLDRLTGPEVVADDVARAKALLEAAGLSSAQVFVNEYGTGKGLLVPGSDVGMIAALESADVAEANLTCYRIRGAEGSSYSGCGSAGVLDGLLRRSFEPRPAYLVYETYAHMTGTRLVTSSTDRQVSAFATFDPIGRTVTVLLGREGEGGSGGGGGARGGGAVASRTGPSSRLAVRLNLSGLEAAGVRWGGLVRVVAEEIPNADGTLLSPKPLLAESVPSSASGVAVRLPPIAAGAAFVVRLTLDGA